MRVVLLAGANSIHTIRWANGLSTRGIDVHLITLHDASEELSDQVTVHRLPCKAPGGYVTCTLPVRRILRQIKPDLLNAHFASGYGTLARLSGFKPLLLSVWGSDVYKFPERSSLHRRLLVSNLRAATAVASTSHAMARVVHRHWRPSHTYITPFGVDEQFFSPRPSGSDTSHKETITIGTVKTLSRMYGIDTLVKSFAILHGQLQSENPEVADRLRLLIVGGGPDENDLRALAQQLGIASKTEFRGRVPHRQVPDCLRELEIYVALSHSESFGVAIVEASACGVPVVVSDADGPSEVVVNGRTGLIVPRDDPVAAAEATKGLVLDPEIRKTMGMAGRRHVLENYTWDRSLEIMIAAYREVIDGAGGSSRR